MRLLITVFLFAGLAGCDAISSARVFAVTFYGTDGAELSQAELRFDPPAPGRTSTGTYRTLSGTRLTASERLDAHTSSTGTVTVELDAQIADGGISLSGLFGMDPFEGPWVRGSFAGPVVGGTFRASPH